LIGIIGATGTYDAIQGYKLCQAYGVCPVSQPAVNPAPSLAGRYTGGKSPSAGNGGNDDDDCKKEWKNARDYCSDLEAMPRNSPEWKNYINIWGGDIGRCIRGQVSERCGGNRVD
jgi:hypothetical protein